MVDFISKFLMSASGFVATIVLTRTLGQERYGAYVVVISVLAWVAIAGNLGLERAIKKRVSETTAGNFVVAGALSQLGLYAAVAIGLWLIRPYLNAYMGIEATLILVGLLAVHLSRNLVQAVLEGQHLVHVSSILAPIEWTSRSIVQVALVLTGFGVTGAFLGYAAGAVIAVLIGSYFVSVNPSRPSRTDFAQLKSYAQFSWLSAIKGRTFLSMDTVVLALFVSNSLIAVYEVAWNLASLFAIFGSSVSRTLFPEMSRLSSDREAADEITGLLRVALTYAGLFIIPGLVGGLLVGDVVLTIYGSGFATGYYILLVLTFARLLYGYQTQFVNTLDAIDRPDLTFRVNVLFVAANLLLNVGLTWQFGWYGAAAATTLSAALGLLLSYYYAALTLEVTLPFAEVGKQFLAAGMMAVVVVILRQVAGESIPIVAGIVAVGAIVYFLTLLGISGEFRRTVRENLPFRVPLPTDDH